MEGMDPLGVVQAGASATGMAAGWDQMNNRDRARAAVNTAKAGASAMGETLPGVNTAQFVMNLDRIYNGWSKMNNEQRAVAAASLTASGAAAAGYAVPGLNIALGAYAGYQYAKAGYNQYYSGGTRNQKVGYGAAVLGGNFVAGPLLGPVSLGVMSVAHSMFKSGKSRDQKGRDWFRGDLKTKGIYNEDFTLDLADGTKANVGLDGGAKHTVRYVDKLLDKHNRSGEIGMYDADYTNDLDFVGSMAGTTLTRLLYGGRDKLIDQTGYQMGNAFLGKAGFGADMTLDNFNTVMGNARGVFAKAGIKSKEDGFELVSRALREGRLSTADAISAQQALNMMYDKNGFDTASKLMQGRWNGVDKLVDAPERTPTVETGAPRGVAPVSTGTAATLMDKDEIRKRNMIKYGMVEA